MNIKCELGFAEEKKYQKKVMMQKYHGGRNDWRAMAGWHESKIGPSNK